MKLSDVREGQVFKCKEGPRKDRTGIVVNRWSDDRSSGGTVVHWEDGSREDYIWSHDDPKVMLLGKGRLETRIVME